MNGRGQALLAETQNRVAVIVVFTIPDGIPTVLLQSELENRKPRVPKGSYAGINAADFRRIALSLEGMESTPAQDYRLFV